MKSKAQYLPPRQTVIYGYTRRMLDETNMNAQSFAMEVAENYIKATAPDVRHVPLQLGHGEKLCHAMKNNAQTIRRYMDGTVKTLPADLEDAWVMSLPEPYRSDCERDLARRRNMLMVPMLPDADTADAENLSTLAKEFGELVHALAPALADGHFDRKDLKYARKILNESDDLITAVLSLRRKATDLLHEAETHGR